MDFDPTRVALVDRSEGNLLIRGMDPAITGAFSYNSIRDALLHREHIDITPYRLLVVNVIDNVGERYVWAPEMVAFGVDPDTFPTTCWPPYLNHPNWKPQAQLGNGRWLTDTASGLGNILWWPFEGLPANERPGVYLHSPGWDFSGLVGYLEFLLQNETNTAIYFHCLLGADRTGALHTGYLLKAKQMLFSAACKVADEATSAGPPNADYQRLRAAYAQSLG
jgi:hypothetical protein